METEEIIKLSHAPLPVKTKRSENYREITQDRVFAGVRDGYFIYMIQNEVFNTNQQNDVEVGCFIDEVQVKLSPQQMVKMHNLFGQLIQKYEQLYGKIKTLEQVAIEKPDLLTDPSSKS
jgi:hypothetical protein